MKPRSKLKRRGIRPIGVVRLSGQLQAIEILPEYAQCLLGIEQAQELQVLYWMHRLDATDRRILTAYPRGDTSKPKRGVFALRSPMRPNPIGSTTVKLVRVEGNKLFVSGLDALDGSPVVDIKVAS